MQSETQTVGLWSVMSAVAYLKGSTQILICDGQSLALINGVAQAPDSYRAVNIDPHGVLMTKGLKLTTGQDAGLQGPQGDAFDTGVAANGYGPASVTSGLWTMAFWISVALRKWRERMSVPNPRILTGTTANGGQSVVEFDDDSPIVTGVQGARLIENMKYWLSESRRVLGADFIGAPYDIFIQGEADKNLTESDYYAQFMEMRRDRSREIALITGRPPIPCTTQIGSYVISTNPNDYGVKIAQVQATIDLGGIVLPPWYPVPVADNVVHPDVTDSKGMADLIGYYLARHEANAAIPAFIPTATRNGNQIVLDYSKGLGAGEFLAFDNGAKYADHGGSPAYRGFEVTGASITSVSLAQNQRAVIIDCSAPATGWSYAMQVGDTTANQSGGKNYGPHRGLLRKGHRLDSVLNPGTNLFEWALSWRGAFA